MLDLYNDRNAATVVHQAASIKPSGGQPAFQNQFDGLLQAPSRLAPQFEERRSKTRYSIELGVRYCNTKGPRSYNIGRTVNISSSGLLVASEGAVREGTALELMIEWPWPLDGRVPLQLVAAGVVVRSSQSSFALALRSYQFRTMKRKPEREESIPARGAI